MRKPTTSEQTEWFIKKQVKKILEDTGWKFWMPNAGAFGRSGVSDFIAVKAPRLLMAIETKYDDVPTPLQLEFLRMIHDTGHHAFLVDETNVGLLREILTQYRDAWSAHRLHVFSGLMKWQTMDTPFDIRISRTPRQRVIEHVDTSADQKHRTQVAGPITGIDHPAWDEQDD